MSNTRASASAKAGAQQINIPASPIAKALAVVGDRWTMLVLREMFLGKTRFTELVEATGASRATLTKRLRALVANGLLYQNPYQSRPVRVEYRLTDKGFALYDMALAIWQWEARWGQHGEHTLPPKLRHRSCGHTFLPTAVCARCSQAIELSDLSYRSIPVTKAEQAYLNEGSLRRSATPAGAKDPANTLVMHYIDLVADHWTPLVMAAAFLGARRYDDMRRQLGIATNILSHRLKLLVEAGVLQQEPGVAGKRLEYRLSKKGRELIAPTLALHVWSIKWLPTEQGASMELRHNCSTKPLQMRMECNRCHTRLQPQDVSIA